MSVYVDVLVFIFKEKPAVDYYVYFGNLKWMNIFVKLYGNIKRNLVRIIQELHLEKK